MGDGEYEEQPDSWIGPSHTRVCLLVGRAICVMVAVIKGNARLREIRVCTFAVFKCTAIAAGNTAPHVS